MIVSPSVWAQLNDLIQNDILHVTGSGAPTSGASGTGVNMCGPGSTYTDTATGKVYINTNTKASPTWTLGGLTQLTGDVAVSAAGVTSIGSGKILSSMVDSKLVNVVSGSISAADIVAVGVGKFGHANGYPIVPNPGANKGIALIAAIVEYVYATAAYGDGGDTTINWTGGGGPVTGVVTAANFAGAASSKWVIFYPLTTAAVTLATNTGLSLTAAAAFTQPGTAAGVINYQVLYTTGPLTY